MKKKTHQIMTTTQLQSQEKLEYLKNLSEQQMLLLIKNFVPRTAQDEQDEVLNEPESLESLDSPQSQPPATT